MSLLGLLSNAERFWRVFSNLTCVGLASLFQGYAKANKLLHKTIDIHFGTITGMIVVCGDRCWGATVATSGRRLVYEHGWEERAGKQFGNKTEQDGRWTRCTCILSTELFCSSAIMIITGQHITTCSIALQQGTFSCIQCTSSLQY